MNLYNTTRIITSLASQIPNIGTIEVGDVYKINAKQDVVYPSIAITQRPHTISHDDEMITYNFYVFYIDRLTSDDSNRMDIQNAAIEALHSLADGLNSYDLEIVNTSVVHTFNERFNDVCSGAYIELSIQTYNDTCNDLDMQFVTEKNLNNKLSAYQPKLISGVNMKTVNGESLLGEGNIEIKGGGTDLKYYKEFDNYAHVQIPSGGQLIVDDSKAEISYMTKGVIVQEDGVKIYDRWIQDKIAGENWVIEQLDSKQDALNYYKEYNGVNFNTVDDGSNFSTISNASFGSSLQYGELVDGDSMNPINILDVGFSGVSVYTGDGCVFTYNGEEVATKAYVDSFLGDINNRLSKI